MKRWNVVHKMRLENPAIDAFLQEIIATCKKHGFIICHSDKYGTFEIREYTEKHVSHLQCAYDWIGDKNE